MIIVTKVSNVICLVKSLQGLQKISVLNGLQNLSCNPGASLSIGKCVVMIL